MNMGAEVSIKLLAKVKEVKPATYPTLLLNKYATIRPVMPRAKPTQTPPPSNKKSKRQYTIDMIDISISLFLLDPL
jgi:hypothetical protein